MDVILVLNAGSSSLKFQIFAVGSAGLERQIKGQIDGIGVHPRFRAADARGAVLIDEQPEVTAIPDLPAATRALKVWLQGLTGYTLRAVGHRVVHGGPDYAAPVCIDEVVLEQLRALEALAPLHQPNNLAPIRLVRELAPDLPQIACFDTAFHRNHPAVADCYAIPRALHDEGVRRYGFHGLSYDYVAQRLSEVAPEIANGRVIVAHLGSGASMCALKAGQSVDSTMGFTALDGLPMGTRPGQIDPGVVLYLIGQKGMTAAEVSSLLYQDSGMKGLSGVRHRLFRAALCRAHRRAGGCDGWRRRTGFHGRHRRERARDPRPYRGEAGLAGSGSRSAGQCRRCHGDICPGFGVAPDGGAYR